MISTTRSYLPAQALRRNFLVLLSIALTAGQAAAVGQAENVCIQCHGAQSGKLGEPVRQWRGSIHGENGVFCHDCHGGDPKDAINAMSPARGFLGVPQEDSIPAFCGRCHVGVLNTYLASAHGKALGKGGPTCVGCHGSHLVKKTSIELINEKNCSRCHPFERARLIRDAMATTDARIAAIDRGIGSHRERGVDTSQLERRLFAARNRFHTLSHVVDVDKLKGQTAEINGDLDTIDKAVRGFDETDRIKKLMGIGAVAVALLAALLLRLYRKTFDRSGTDEG